MTVESIVDRDAYTGELVPYVVFICLFVTTFLNFFFIIQTLSSKKIEDVKVNSKNKRFLFGISFLSQ